VAVDEREKEPRVLVKPMNEPEGLLMMSKSRQSTWKVKQ
jgi:hypothetical protein